MNDNISAEPRTILLPEGVQAPPPQPLLKPPAPRKKRLFKNGIGVGAAIAVLVCCIFFASTLGFLGAMAAMKMENDPAQTATISSLPTLPQLTERERAAVSAPTAPAITAALASNQPLTPAQVAAVAADSVVEIVTEREVQVFNFWGRGYSSQTVPGAGSGVIISTDGHIITNNHVIDQADKIEITLRNGEIYTATLVATDAKTDVAVLKIDAKGLTAASLGDSDALVVGEQAVVIGNPLGQLGGTITSGVISALDRPISFQEENGTNTMNLLQTDAAVNPGNSGGGMFNQYGQLVGIVVAKSGGIDVEGLGFAIPINDVRGVIDDLISYGYARGRIMLGVEVIYIEGEQAMNYYRVEKPGTYINRVTEGSNAERAGLKAGDLLVSLNGKNIAEAEQVSEVIQSLNVGDTLTVTYERDGQQQTVEIVMQETVPQDLTAKVKG